MMNQKQSVTSEPIPYKSLFPWLHLFRVFRLAVDFQKIILASLAILMLFLGSNLFNNLPFASPHQTRDTRIIQQNLNFSPHSAHQPQIKNDLLPDHFSHLAQTLTQEQGLLKPMAYFTKPVLIFFDTKARWNELAYATTQLIWAIIVWSIFGGAISRIAAIQFAQDEHVGIIAALRFSSKRILSLASAPLLPFAGIGFFWGLCFLIGLLGNIPGAGATIVSLLWGLAYLFAFVMSLILLVTLAGWPLMMTTISVEDSDGFDGLSRVFSYLFGRIWYFLWLVIVTLCYGTLCLVFAGFLLQLVSYLSYWGVSWGMGGQETGQLLNQQNRTLATTITMGWQSILGILFSGFTISFFWSANTVIYFLLRKCDDGTPLDHVYNTDEEEEQSDDLPLAGVAKAGEPVIERPVTPDETDEKKTDPQETP